MPLLYRKQYKHFNKYKKKKKKDKLFSNTIQMISS